MAKGDLVGTPSPVGGFGGTSATFTLTSAPLAGDLVMFATAARTQAVDLTNLPFASTAIISEKFEDPFRFYLFGKICDGTEGTSWTVPFVGDTAHYVHPVHVRGVYASLGAALSLWQPGDPGLTVSAENPIAVLAAAQTAPSDGRAFGLVFLPYPASVATVTTWSNGFTQLAPAEAVGNTMIRIASRVFADEAADVQTTCTLDAGVPFGWKFLLFADGTAAETPAGVRRARVVTSRQPARRAARRAISGILSGASVTPGVAPALIGARWQVTFPRPTNFNVRFTP